jgi:viroplasmin and RNaseH domain-containing protein
VTLAEAEVYMAVDNRVKNYEYKIKDGAGETILQGKMTYYAVANGRNPGI